MKQKNIGVSNAHFRGAPRQMRLRRVFKKRYLLVFFSIFLSACATQKASYKYLNGTDFSKYRSYAWVNVDKGSKDSQRAKSQLVDRRIIEAIDSAMTVKRLRKVSDDPDMLVNYHVSVSAQEKQQPKGRVNVDTASDGRGSSVGPRAYKEGTLVIDMIDAKNKQLLWQGWGLETVNQDTNSQHVTALIDQVVWNIFENYPPSGK
jgi:hypothetical protein